MTVSHEDASKEVAFYQHVLQTLNDCEVPFLIGGAFAFYSYTGIARNTKDLDIFIRRRDFDAITEALRPAGYETELTFPHWLGKIRSHGYLIDLIFSSGNGLAEVDDLWFEHAGSSVVLDVPVKVCPVEEQIWSKAFILERERYDGADVAHLLHSCPARIDWPHLLARFGRHWRVLLSHLTLFGFIYPADRNLVPAWVMEDLLARLAHETASAPPAQPVCQGTLLSREQYLIDVQDQGLIDARLQPHGNMSEAEAAIWTAAINAGQNKQKPEAS